VICWNWTWGCWRLYDILSICYKKCEFLIIREHWVHPLIIYRVCCSSFFVVFFALLVSILCIFYNVAHVSALSILDWPLCFSNGIFACLASFLFWLFYLVYVYEMDMLIWSYLLCVAIHNIHMFSHCQVWNIGIV